MDYEAFVADLPTQRTVSFSSVEENEEAFRRHGVNQPMRQMGPGRFRSDLTVLETEEASLFVDRYSQGVSLFLEPPAGMVGFLFPRSTNGRFLANGRDVGNDELLVMPRGSATDIIIPGLAGSEAIGISKLRFDELVELLCPTLREVVPDDFTMVQGDTARLHVLREAVLDLIADPESDPHGERMSNLVARTIIWMGHSLGNGRPECIEVNGTRQRIAKQAQTYIETHYRAAVRIEDLCRATGVGVRTLQRCFREYFDMAISDYIKTVRLDAARRQLAAARPSGKSVTTIALQHGFTHLGRFSMDFRKRFGQSPSETLAKLDPR